MSMDQSNNIDANDSMSVNSSHRNIRKNMHYHEGIQMEEELEREHLLAMSGYRHGEIQMEMEMESGERGEEKNRPFSIFSMEYQQQRQHGEQDEQEDYDDYDEQFRYPNPTKPTQHQSQPSTTPTNPPKPQKEYYSLNLHHKLLESNPQEYDRLYSKYQKLPPLYSLFEYPAQLPVSSLDFSKLYPYQVGMTMFQFEDINKDMKKGQKEQKLMVNKDRNKNKKKMIDVARLMWQDFQEDYHNYRELQTYFDTSKKTIKTLETPYTPMYTQLKFAPKSLSLNREQPLQYLATSNSQLHIFEIIPDPLTAIFTIKQVISLPQQIRPDYNNSMITSFAWDQDKIYSVSLDGCLSVWDVGQEICVNSMAIHQKECCDVKIKGEENMIMTCGAQGCVKLFDKRDITHYNVLYRNGGKPIYNVQWSNNSCLFSTIQANSNIINIFDIRKTQSPMYQLGQDRHYSQISSMKWHPGKKDALYTAGYDGQMCYYDLMELDRAQGFMTKFPILSMAWSELDPHWVAIGCGSAVKMMQVSYT